MTTLITDTNQALFEALGHMIQAEVLIEAVLKQDPDTYELSDSTALLCDAISQLRGELRNRQEMRGAA